ncbi:TERF1-interacting nuclear factor 2 isoform X6 [Ahaetulla prasina]|uniref:TERF1-interacting nuclear factor 2 isoform X6 n=1 Tax=Ahaetulla prasina TaxID=499056 RepID=UPI0026474E5C|nr:TERF1-interacting nuclear factor 2 isoform X6 [Ahaetulla prasina]
MGDDRAGEAASEGPCGAVALRVVAAAAWHVVRGRRFADFPRVLTFLENVAEAAPELVPFQHLAKLRLGLQAKIVMNMLQEDQPQGKIYDAIDTYFPENEAPLHHSKATAKDLEMVQTAQENFRILILRLLSDSMQKDIYVQAMTNLPPPLPLPQAPHARAGTKTPRLRLAPHSQTGAEAWTLLPASQKGIRTGSPRKQLKIWCQIPKAKEAPHLFSAVANLEWSLNESRGLPVFKLKATTPVPTIGGGAKNFPAVVSRGS